MPPGETEPPSMQGCLQALEVINVLGLIDSVVTAGTGAPLSAFITAAILHVLPPQGPKRLSEGTLPPGLPWFLLL